ncbi:MAG: endonuclease V [Nanoarchaeota archaeon]
MDTFELKKEQQRLAPKIELRNGFPTLKTIAGTSCIPIQNKLLACIAVCEYPSLKLLESKTYVLHDPLPYKPGFLAYREMPAIIEAINLLEEEPDLLLVTGAGIAHPQKLGIASHLGLALNKPTIGITEYLLCGKVDKGKIIMSNEIVGFEVTTKEHANPMYVSPGHLVTLGTSLNVIRETIRYPHKMPEPIHLAHKIARKKAKEMRPQEKQSENMVENTEEMGSQQEEKVEA